MSGVDRSADRRQRFAARVRRTPGYLAVKDGVLPRLRGNTALTDLVWRVFTPAHGLGEARRMFRSDGLDVPDADRLPVIAFTVLGADDAGVDRALRAITELRRDTAAFRAVLVVDRPVLARVRDHGIVADHVIGEADWYGDADAYAEYVGRRLVSVVQGFRVWHLAHLGPGGQVSATDEQLIRAIRGAMSSSGAAAPDDSPSGAHP
ncbi:hypothetical protein [uncultured Phycicoccus sp.]|uniref:hypothetical protein n=1 Tax=uncultured Phycicoccus sp. TaxID=661422 RepID=UPI0026090206|nr:hypothetical protein [uncultured Phycicoccus sp.]